MTGGVFRFLRLRFFSPAVYFIRFDSQTVSSCQRPFSRFRRSVDFEFPSTPDSLRRFYATVVPFAGGGRFRGRKALSKPLRATFFQVSSAGPKSTAAPAEVTKIPVNAAFPRSKTTGFGLPAAIFAKRNRASNSRIRCPVQFFFGPGVPAAEASVGLSCQPPVCAKFLTSNYFRLRKNSRLRLKKTAGFLETGSCPSINKSSPCAFFRARCIPSADDCARWSRGRSSSAA